MDEGAQSGKTRGSAASDTGSSAGPHRGVTFGGEPRKSSKVEMFATLVGSLALAALAVAVCTFAIRGWASEDARVALATEKATSTVLRKELSSARAVLEDFRATLGKANIELRELHIGLEFARSAHVPTSVGLADGSEECGCSSSSSNFSSSSSSSNDARQQQQHNKQDVDVDVDVDVNVGVGVGRQGPSSNKTGHNDESEMMTTPLPPAGWKRVLDVISGVARSKSGQLSLEFIRKTLKEELGHVIIDVQPDEEAPVGLPRAPQTELGRAVDTFDRKMESFYRARGFKLWRAWFGARRLENFESGFAVELADMELILRVCLLVRPRRILAIGNAFGYSSLALSLACNAPVDVLDAEQDGDSNRKGTRLTHEIARSEGLNVEVSVGYSPGDLPKVGRAHNQTYDLAFIDGLHTNRQLIQDFLGIRPFLAPSPVVICHDVGLFGLWPGILQGLRALKMAGIRASYRVFEGQAARNRLGTGFYYWDSEAEVDGTLETSLERAFEGFGPRLFLQNSSR
eukprot:CAMPEP_0206598216 /NCGR_PEP_ID=MMETSP0325_2-20121206/44526_1 /ASSEMBLY_ACC=CAM_ASM_000347 /TAXON_ID=2866 /ORGANISM="Crypthecodinium cohnii, Strain Seligo" /LENGTH=514 /DNA_ID=CAMNT_0054109203 /DNA_START=177 /DNA_END=1721 /DNA_ORIENTATION=+